jgi:hypothetical protein
MFISYNPHSELEQTLAIRLHTIGSVSGFQMFLPDRYHGSKTIDISTQERIRQADWFVVFTRQQLSPIVLEEIRFAHQLKHDKSKIIIVYDTSVGELVTNTEQCTKIPFDVRQTGVDSVLTTIMQTINHAQKLEEQRMKTQIKQAEYARLEAERLRDRNALLALFGAGVSLLALGIAAANTSDASALQVPSSSKPKKAPAKRPSTRKTAKR